MSEIDCSGMSPEASDKSRIYHQSSRSLGRFLRKKIIMYVMKRLQLNMFCEKYFRLKVVIVLKGIKISIERQKDDLGP